MERITKTSAILITEQRARHSRFSRIEKFYVKREEHKLRQVRPDHSGGLLDRV
jgi:hypothetical protein